MNHPRLFLDKIADNFDPSRDLALGPWCFIGREDVWPEWESLAFEEPFADPKVQWRDWLRTRILANRLSRQLGAELNSQHGTSYGERYWRELTILWLILLIQAAWLRYLQIDAAIERWGEDTLAVSVTDTNQDDKWAFADDLDFYHNGPKNPDYDLWICSLLLAKRLPTAWSAAPGRSVDYRFDAAKAATEENPSLKSRIVSAIIKRRSVYNLTGGGRIEWLLSLLVPLMPRRPQIPAPTADELSTEATKTDFPDDFIDLVTTVLIPATMPQTLTNNFTHYEKKVAGLPFKKGRLFITAASKYVPLNRFLTAHAIEAGERVFRYQHGGLYGISNIMIAHEMEYYDQAFISWGWQEDDRLPGKAIALPAPSLSRIANSHKRRTSDILFIGTNIELGPYPFKPSPQASRYIDYRRRKVQFLNNLSKAARTDLRYRPYFRTGSDLNDLVYVERFVGKLPIVNGPLMNSLLGCAMVIIDHPGTTLYQALAANVPTILTWSPEDWPMHKRGEQQLNILEEAGLFFAKSEDAASRVNELYGQTDEWWRSGPVQKARRAWCNGNALVKRNWLMHWIYALKELP